MSDLRAGAARRRITPAVGAPLVGWASRAAGDPFSRWVHDDLYVHALVVEDGRDAWGMITFDLIGVDALAVARIRSGVRRETGLDPGGILVCATHCHSGPAPCPIVSAVPFSELNAVRSDGSLPAGYGRAAPAMAETLNWAGDVDLAWRETFIESAVEAAAEAWHGRAPVEVGYGETVADGLASSRRVLLSDGSWADPRREAPAGAGVVSRTEVDPLVRVLAFRRGDDGSPVAFLVNYGTHPWVFSSPGISAELPGAVSAAVAAGYGSPAPVVLYSSGPEGDATLIWNIDVESVWRTRPDESVEESLARRCAAFDRELARLGARLAGKVLAAVDGIKTWQPRAQLAACRREVLIPLREGYRRPDGLMLAGWQEPAPPGYHASEVQALRAGPVAVLGVPGECFVSLGRAIRHGSPFPGLIVAALANDFGEVSYIADRAAYEQGGYELVTSTARPGAGEALVEAAIDALNLLEI